MTNKPREFWISMCTFNDGYTEIYETRTAEFEPCPPAEKIHAIEAAPVLEKIARLELALQKCKEQRGICTEKHENEPCRYQVMEKELESMLQDNK